MPGGAQQVGSCCDGAVLLTADHRHLGGIEVTELAVRELCSSPKATSLRSECGLSDPGARTYNYETARVEMRGAATVRDWHNYSFSDEGGGAHDKFEFHTAYS